MHSTPAPNLIIMSLQTVITMHYAAIIFQIRRPLGTLFELLLPIVAILILIGLRFAHRKNIIEHPGPLAFHSFSL